MGGCLDRLQQLDRRGVLDEEPGCPRLQGVEGVLVGVECGEDQDFGWIRKRPDAAGGFDAVHLRHADVHQDHIGTGCLHGDDGIAAVAGFADHLEDGVGVDQRLEAGPDQFLVVDDHDPDHGRLRRGKTARTTKLSPSGPASSWPS